MLLSPHLFNYQNKVCWPDWVLLAGIRELSENKTCLNYADKNLVLANKSNDGHQHNTTNTDQIN